MKKLIAVIIAALMLMSASALAELEVKQVEYIPVASYDSVYCYLFAEVVNNGTEPCTVDGSFDMLDANGTAVATQDIYSCAPYTLAPGETGFISTYGYNDGVPADYPDVRYTILAASAYSEPSTPVTVASATVETGVDEWGSAYCEIVVTMTNDTPNTIEEPSAAFGLYDQNGTLMYASSTSLYNVAVPAGSSAAYMFYAPTSLIEAWDAAGRTPTTVSGIAYLD